MYSYRDNVTGMAEAMNRKRAKYIREERLNEQNKKDHIIDLTGCNSNNIQEQYIDAHGDDITVTYFNNDGSRS